MYHSTPIVGAVAAGGSLALTGASVLWILLGGFALLSAGLALTRIVARREG